MSQSTIQDSLLHFHSRKLFLHTPLYQSPPATINTIGNEQQQQPDSYTGRGGSSIDANVVMVLAVLLCALICSLALNSIIKFALWCSGLLPVRPILSNSRTTIAQVGINKKALKTFPTISYSPGVVNHSGLDTECAICLSEFTTGERIRILPKCNHGFHVRCIDKWLNSHPSCPTCRHCLIDISKKKTIIGCNQVEMATPPSIPLPLSLPPPSQTMITLCPLEPEVMVRNYRGV